MTLDMLIFLISAVVSVFAAVMMISVRNPVASVLYFILSLVAQAVVYVQLDALFVGAILVIVYAGAIMVLFLFVIMLLNLRGEEDLQSGFDAVSRYTKLLVGLLIAVELIFMVKSVLLPGAVGGVLAPVAKDFGSIRPVAKLLFTDYMFPFQLTGVLLTIAVVGAVVLARRDTDSEPPTETTPETTAAPAEERTVA